MSQLDWMPRIDRTRCIGCKQCVETCPMDALSQVDGKARLTRPEKCIYCLACEDICPQGAIELPFLIVTKAQYEGATHE